MPRTFNYEIKKHIGTLSESAGGDFTLEINQVSYNGAAAKIDIRRWDRRESGERMLKGVTLTNDEWTALKELVRAEGA